MLLGIKMGRSYNKRSNGVLQNRNSKKRANNVSAIQEPVGRPVEYRGKIYSSMRAASLAIVDRRDLSKRANKLSPQFT